MKAARIIFFCAVTVASVMGMMTGGIDGQGRELTGPALEHHNRMHDAYLEANRPPPVPVVPAVVAGQTVQLQPIATKVSSPGDALTNPMSSTFDQANARAYFAASGGGTVGSTAGSTARFKAGSNTAGLRTNALRRRLQ